MEFTTIQNKIIPMESLLTRVSDALPDENAVLSAENPTFMDVFTNIINDAVQTNAQVDADILALSMGEAESVEAIQLNLTKAEIATDLLVTVKNTAVEAYNEIIKMQI
jgi:flagellar hook-basal body complex protein FliE